jgi:hypothetical protein
MAYIDGPIVTLSPDGESVVYPTQDKNVVVVPADGSAPPLTLFSTATDGTLIYPTVSPDSNTVMIGVDEDSSRYPLYTVPMAGDEPVEVHPDLPDGDSVAPAVFTPDSTRIVYRLRQTSSEHLYSVPVGGGPRIELFPSETGCGRFAVSSDSQIVVAVCDQKLVAAPVSGGATTQLPYDTYPGFVETEDEIYVKPNSAAVIYRSQETTRPAAPYNMYTVAIGGGTPMQRNQDFDDYGVREWWVSEDGATLIYIADSRLWAVPTSGGTPPALSPDGCLHPAKPRLLASDHRQPNLRGPSKVQPLILVVTLVAGLGFRGLAQRLALDTP